METNKLKLASCAYIFHWSGDNSIYWSDEKPILRKAIEKAGRLGEWHEYQLNENGNAVINLDGLDIEVNDCMVQEITGVYKNKDIINNRKFTSFDNFFENNKKHFRLTNDTYSPTLWGETYKSMVIEMFPNSLNYFRAHFKRNVICFIVSNGKFFLSDHANYTEISESHIIDRLGVDGVKAKKLINDFLSYIK